MDFHLWLAFVAASSVLLIIPGPTILLVLSYALTQGRPVAVATALGVALGDFLAMTTSLLGLGALVLASATVFTVLKWVGALYLAYLGIKMLRGAEEMTFETDGAASDAKEGRAVFGHAAIVTALNPKSIAFFIAFVPQFIVTDAPLGPQFGILIATFVTLAALNALAFALLADRLRRQIARPSVTQWMARCGGVALLAMGVATAALRRA